MNRIEREKQTVKIADRTCTIYKSDQPEYMLIQPIDEHDLEVLDNEVATIQFQSNKHFTLVAFEVKDWNKELTPWPAPAVFGNIPFGDGAVATLSFIKDMLIPQMEHMLLFDKDKIQCLLGGYSLAGFFALWAGYHTEIFDGIAAVSPSVWYPQWMEYAENNSPSATSIYLSLGDK